MDFYHFLIKQVYTLIKLNQIADQNVSEIIIQARGYKMTVVAT